MFKLVSRDLQSSVLADVALQVHVVFLRVPGS